MEEIESYLDDTSLIYLEQNRAEREFCCDQHLSSALIHDDLLILKKGVEEGHKKITKSISKLFDPNPYNLGKESFVTWYEVYKELKSGKIKEGRTRLLSEKVANIQREWATPENKKEINIQVPGEVKDMEHKLAEITQIHKKRHRSRKANDSFSIEGKKITFHKDYFSLGTEKGNLIGTWADFVCCMDMIKSRRDLLLYTYNHDGYTGAKRYNSLARLILSGDMLLEKYGQKAYNIFKVLPSIIVCTVIRKEDEDIKVDYLSPLLKGLRKEGISTNDPFFREIQKAYSSCHVRDFISLGGIWKIWGHPTIRTHEGLTDFREKGGPIKNKPDKSTLKLINGQFKLMLVEGYYSKHSRWPKVNTSQCCQRIQDMYRKNTWILMIHPRERRVNPMSHRNRHTLVECSQSTCY